MPLITSLYAAIGGVMNVGLVMNVVRNRWRSKTSIGNPKDDYGLERAIRAHGNFSEFVPLGLILLFLVEGTGASATTVHAMGSLWIICRLAHIYGITAYKGANAFRFVGIAGSNLLLVFSSFLLFKNYIQ